MSVPSQVSSIYPVLSPGTRVLLRVNPILSRYHSFITLLTTSIFIGSFAWLPFLLRKLYHKWRKIEDKKLRTVYGLLFLTLFVWSPQSNRIVGKCLKVRDWPLWSAMIHYFGVEILSDSEGGDTRDFDMLKDQSIMAVSPHGVFPFPLALLALSKTLRKYLGKFRPVVARATTYIPLGGTLVKFLYPVYASRSKLNEALALKHKVAIHPGGISDMFVTHPDKEATVLRYRKGFIRMAIKHGIPVVPVYCFGASQAFRRVNLPLLATISNTLRIAICLFYGRWGFIFPFRQKLMFVIGRTIWPPTGLEGKKPLMAMVDKMHKEYCDELTRIFNTHKKYYGWEGKTLSIV